MKIKRWGEIAAEKSQPPPYEPGHDGHFSEGFDIRDVPGKFSLAHGGFKKHVSAEERMNHVARLDKFRRGVLAVRILLALVGVFTAFYLSAR